MTSAVHADNSPRDGGKVTNFAIITRSRFPTRRQDRCDAGYNDVVNYINTVEALFRATGRYGNHIMRSYLDSSQYRGPEQQLPASTAHHRLTGGLNAEPMESDPGQA
jgi:hypothetical protein